MINNNSTKKPRYVRKYDFFQYFNREKCQWFIPEQKIKDDIANEISNSAHMNDEDENDDASYSEDDPYEYSADVVDLYHTDIEEKKDAHIDDQNLNDPKIIEGMIIDKKAKMFISSLYDNFIVVDFEDENNDYLSNEQAAIETINILKDKEQIILFQPTFIYANKAIAKPDALIKDGNQYTLIEVKSSSRVKHIHLLDIIYQYNIVNKILQHELNSTISNCAMCLSKYCQCNKFDIKFILTEYADGFKVKTPKEDKKDMTYFPQGFTETYIKNKSDEKTLNDGKHLTYMELFNRYKDGTFINVTPARADKFEDFVNHTTDVYNTENFFEIINELYQYTPAATYDLLPSAHYSSWWKSVGFFPEIKKYWACHNDKFFHYTYSGKLINYKQCLTYSANQACTQPASFLAFVYHEKIKKLGNKQNVKPSAFIKYYENFTFDFPWKITDNTKKKFNSLSTKKVYFDFESLNLATRIIENGFPFMQVVNQVSIIFDNGDGIYRKKDGAVGCDNLIFDPLAIDLDVYKKIIDAILPTNNSQEYTYIVYNKSFECTRLKEMATFINEPSYVEKVNLINGNIFDLADFFTVTDDAAIVVPELKGFYSIKKVLPLVQKYYNDGYLASGSVDYKSALNVHNGGEAQEHATKRFFQLYTDQQWHQISIDLAKYCENDVRAMIAVELFVKHIIQLHDKVTN